MILQRLWRAYGFVLADKTLHYSVMLLRKKVNMDRVDYCHFKSHFHRCMINVIRRNEISECHLFALYFAMVSCLNESQETNYSELRAHQHGFVQILKKLISKKSVSRDSSPLRYLFAFVLSCVCRMSSYWEEREDISTNLDYEMQLLAENISIPENVSDLRLNGQVAALYWRWGGMPNWLGLEFSVRDDIRGLYGCFRKIFNSSKDQKHGDITIRQVAHSLWSIRQKSTEMQNLPCVSNLIHLVNCVL